jgi:hypothetical protein
MMEEVEQRVSYVRRLMSYIEAEYNNIPDDVTTPMANHFNECYDQNVNIPNAAGLFYEKFLRASSF